MAEQSFFQKNINPHEHAKNIASDPEFIGKISKNVNNVAASLKILEERYSNLRNKTQLSEQNIIDIEKEVNEDIKSLSDQIMELKHSINDIKEKLGLITGEIKNLVSKNEFIVLERYLDMWQPMNFVTKKDLDRVIEDKKKS